MAEVLLLVITLDHYTQNVTLLDKKKSFIKDNDVNPTV